MIPAAIVIATTAAPTEALISAAIRNATMISGRPLFSSAGRYNIAHSTVLKYPADNPSTSDHQKDLSYRPKRFIHDLF